MSHDDQSKSENLIINQEKQILISLGYKVEPYLGNIPKAEFSLRIDGANTEVDVDKVGSHNQIYVEPDAPICYKTGIVGIIPPTTRIALSEENKVNNLPGHIKEGLFLARINQYELSGIPKFYGFVELPDGRISVAQQYIPNGKNIPVLYETHNGSEGFTETSSESIYSIFNALEEVATTIDAIHALGGSVNDTEIRSNLVMETDSNNLTTKIWVVDFEGYGLHSPKNVDQTQTKNYYRPDLTITMSTLVEDAVRSRSDNTARSISHPAGDYLNFVLGWGENVGNWQKPESSFQMVRQVNEILKDHPLEEYRRPEYAPAPDEYDPGDFNIEDILI